MRDIINIKRLTTIEEAELLVMEAKTWLVSEK